MTEIGLLMTGVLNTTQPTLPPLPQQRPFHLENGVHKSANSQLSQLVPTPQITPPEFIKTNEREKPKISTLALKREKILKQIRQKHLSLDSIKVAESQDISTIGKDGVKLSRYQAYNRQAMPILYFGSSGMSVRILQRLLVSNGYGIRIDGIFGPLTETAIKAFQNQRNLLVDGVVGQKTWWELTI
ncbi:peptidoglycan-binding domain-containing protein [Trichormus variabilis]|uniref:Peptidoglycan binding-like domain-containing protein n=1 Tax=Trichormus variabilis SAG 1403-4b TaxID=447716 RepID=A0A3S1ALR1_ANAVA|nr:peptidoglycan-binding protein [Trichormus variabilis]MBD2625041.1 peptidoglycan-binding protein [Trichormus variabilis FACHB-164]RUS95025.1 hypothetical protein DSM107003_32250 [Trichormus variabilis SAG 1403-4b]